MTEAAARRARDGDAEAARPAQQDLQLAVELILLGHQLGELSLYVDEDDDAVFGPEHVSQSLSKTSRRRMRIMSIGSCTRQRNGLIVDPGALRHSTGWK